MALPRAKTLLRESDGGEVRRTDLPGGLRVITERVPGVRSVAFGVWVGVGSCDETDSQMGSAHFLEHLLFKGTPTRSALDISSAIDRVGGEMNAFTSKEYTCYYARVLDENAPVAIDVICDIVLNATLATRDIEGERNVILDEIAMHDDDHSGVAADAFIGALFGGTPLGRPVQGTAETINAVTPRAIRSFYQRRYVPPVMVVSAAGNVDHTALVRQVAAAFSGVTVSGVSRLSSSARSAGAPERLRVIGKSSEQAHVVMGMPGIDRADDRRYALSVLNTALGGGMSSRLFQEVREKRGLAYTVYSFAERYSTTGAIGIYAGCIPNRLTDVVGVCLEELQNVVAHGLTAEELERGKGQVRGATVLGQEDTFSRMSRIAKATLADEPVIAIDEVIRRVDAVTPDDIAQVAAELLTADVTVAAVGPSIDDNALLRLIA